MFTEAWAYTWSGGYNQLNKNTSILLYVMALVAAVVIVDIVFFRHRFWERLLANIGIVLLFVAFYLAFFKR